MGMAPRDASHNAASAETVNRLPVRRSFDSSAATRMHATLRVEGDQEKAKRSTIEATVCKEANNRRICKIEQRFPLVAKLSVDYPFRFAAAQLPHARTSRFARCTAQQFHLVARTPRSCCGFS